MEKITHELLKSWNPCSDGYERFCELFPDGADLETAINGLVSDGHDDWSYWLFCRSKENKLFENVTCKGYRNSGDRNSGHRNSGDHNSGDHNSGDHNSGDHNSGDWNSGYMNSKTPKEIFVFNKPCLREVFNKAYKPSFLYFDLTYWVNESDMTEKEKIEDPYFYVRCGQLRKRDYKEAFKKSWDEANHDDRIRVKDLPNFDSEIFFEISGIDLRGK